MRNIKFLFMMLFILITFSTVAQGGKNLGDYVDGDATINPNDKIEKQHTLDSQWESWGGDYAKGLELMQGKGLLEDWFVDGFLPLYDDFMVSEYGSLIFIGQAIAGVLALIYLSWIGWGFLSGDKQWELLPLLRPFAMGLIIMNWIPFVNMVKAPFVQIQKGIYQDYSASQDELNALRIERFMYQQKAIDYVFREGAYYEAMQKEQEESAGNLIKEGIQELGNFFNKLVSPIAELKARLGSGIQLFLGSFVEIIAMWILRAAVYGIFFIQVLFQTILIIIGPLAAGFSILPAFRNSFVSWLTKFINICCYGFIAFIVMKLGVALQKFAFQAEIERYQLMMGNKGEKIDQLLMLGYASNGTSSYGLVVITFLITAIGIFCVPKLADYVIGAAGSNSALLRGASGAISGAAGGKIGMAAKAVGSKI